MSTSLPRLASTANESKLFKTKNSLMETSKVFLERFNAKRESIKNEEDGNEK